MMKMKGMDCVNMNKYEKEIKSTLREILRFVGADQKYAEYAQLHSYMEWLLRDCGVKDA